MIAIIGASCCLPGGIESGQDFWETWCAGKNMASAVPPERWNSERFYHSDATVPGKTYMHQGHFVDRDLTQFDNEAFRIFKREAEGLDPQQRLLLELTWQAIEEFGLPLDNLPSRKVGIYVGGFTLDYFLGQFAAENRNHIGVHTSAGSALTMLSNRISHTFDFRGLSLTVDTACWVCLKLSKVGYFL
ncbi:polyketide synthase [Halomonas sp. CUBES01]|uniref:Polyketide synthase n=1 Tax=Vreelandella gomseomensis TaxID=370766 RepID=A0ABU1G8D9_9GAMM|nr:MULTISPECIES: polyketide synthase [Halomonas]MDR5873701.1 polyketide synthase [Halomonas gomseomensis]MEC4768454.1 polyketide synthase [Halomonas sp. CUBES01]